MWEQCYIDPSSGQPLTGSFMDYGMPHAHTLPSFKTEIVEVLSPTNPLGIKAGGEGGTTPALAVIVSAIVDALRDYGIRDYVVRDLHGYYLTFGHHLFNTGPSIAIDRVDVPVRLEKRLAALLQDLAKHKRMSVNSCLEEMLLHTNEGVGPHTQTTLRYIEELKKKHGIDYDSHASYRFVEK
jgi:hypothetical protein